MGAWCLFSWLWWTVSWTLHCTLPSAVKHNATRLHHGGVWGYRWPAVCLCSAPLGQLEPSISRPPTPSLPPMCLSVRAWPATQQYKGVSSGLLGRGTLLCVFFCCCFGLFLQAFWDNPIWHFHADLLTVLACLPLILGVTFSEPAMTVDWNIAPRSTCSRRPLSIYRWKELKPIIVFLEGRLHPWTLWHTFKESGHNVFSLIHGLWH